MLTAKNVSAKKAIEYFLQGYYQEGKSRWFGIGAEKLGLAGAIGNEQVFKNIVEGLSVDGSEELCARNVDTEKRRAALDCTFSAPKSVSLTALVAQDERLVEAHIKAVEQTLSLIQERYAHTRITMDKTRQTVNTKNLVVAQFDHIETRELDPHLHTHCLVMNMVQTPDGKWYSHLNDAIFAHKKMLGMAYQNFLALEVEKLGYEIEPKGHGQFEIKGYTEEQLMDFSKRRQQILAVAGNNSTWAERESAWRATRQRKQEVLPEELKLKWQQEAAALGITFVQPKLTQLQLTQPDLETTITPNAETAEQKKQSYQKSLDEAIAHCSQRAVAFELEKLEQFILEEGRPCNITQLEPLLRENAELIRIESQAEIRFTTVSALQREIATIRLMQQGKDAVQAIAPVASVVAQIEKTELNAGQRQAVIMAATTTDQFMAWQGVAGAGKTHALKQLKAIAQDKGYKVLGFAPSAEAAKVLGDDIKAQTETVARLLVSQPALEPEPNQIWIVDEAGLLSAKDAHALLQRATDEQARVILVGDTRQLSAVEAGNPFKSLQQAGITTAYLNESQRQKKAPELKLAVDLIAEGRIKAGFARLKANECIKTVTPETKSAEIANAYMAVAKEERGKTLVLAGTNAERLELTQAIRQQLKDEGSLGVEATTTQLKAKNLTTVQMRYTHHFEVGDVVMPTRNYKRRGLEKGQQYEVFGVGADTLKLKSIDGKRLEVDTKFDKAVYSKQPIEIAVGDRLKWTKNNRVLGQRNGQEFTVTAISGNTADIQYLDSDRTETINLASALHLDYALVSTTYSSQGKTADSVLIAADSTVSKESFYVAVSRARFGLKLYTEDPQRLLELAAESKANENVLDVLRDQIKQQAQTTVNHNPKRVNQPQQQQAAGSPNLISAQPDREKAESTSVKVDNVVELPIPQFDAASLGQSIAQQLLGDNIDQLHENSNQKLLNRSAKKSAAPKVEQLIKPFEFSNSNSASPIPTGKGVGASNLINLAQQPEAKQHKNLEQVEYLQRQADKNTDAVLADVEKLIADYPADTQQSPEPLLSQKQVNPPETHQENNDEIQQQNIQFDGASLGKNIATQLETVDAEELQPENTKLLWKASTRQQLVPPLQLLQLKQNPPISIPPFQGKTNQLLNTEGDRANSLQLARIEQLQHRADKSADAAMAHFEEINRTAPQNASELVTQQVSTEPERQEITNENTTARDTQQPERFDPTDLGRSIAASLEASDERTQTDQAVPERLLLRARSTSRARRSLGAIEQFSHRILQSGVSANQQHSRLPIPTSGRTQAARIQRDADESDRSVARQLEQIDQRQRTADTQTERTLTRLGNYHADLTAADEAAIPLVTDSRAIGSSVRDEANLGQPATANPDNQQQQPAVNAQTVEVGSNLEKETAMTKLLSNVLEWVRVQTDRPQLLHYNNKLGVVVGRIKVAGSENVIVRIDGYTPRFDNSELIPVKSPQLNSPSLPTLSNAQTPTSSSRTGSKTPQINTDAIIKPNLSSRDESFDTQQPRTANGADIGRRISSRLEANSRTIRPNRESTRPDRGPDGNFSSSDNGRHQATSRKIEAPRAETQSRVIGRSQRLRELGIQFRSTTDRVVGRSGQSNHQAERANQDTAAVEQNHFTADAKAAGVKQNYQRIAQSYLSPNQSTARNFRTAGENHRIYEEQRESVKALAEQMRELPLEDIAPHLGLELDRHDKHKWRGEGQIISINDQKFYDHLTQKGGYGAIDLVMHVNRQDFKQALSWLSNGISDLTPPRMRSHQQKPSSERQPFTPPVVDESKWAWVRKYLTQKRQLPTALVDELHRSGIVYADSKQNAVFIRKSIDGNITGASLRGTYKDSTFKGLATGSRREGGWFAFTHGVGQLQRVVLTESSIDAISAAALSQQNMGITMFISADGAGSVPLEWLTQQQLQGVQVIAAHDADRAGEEMAWKLASELPNVTRATPTVGKDWNEQLLQNHAQTTLDPKQWQRIAQALGKPSAYLNHVGAVVEAYATGRTLSKQAQAAMQQDFSAYRQTSSQLWQWQKTAKALGETDAYLKQIAQVAIAFHHPIEPSPISDKTSAAMQQDQQKLVYRQRYSELATLVRSEPKLANSTNKEIDLVVAMSAYNQELSNHGEVGRIIAQSNQIKAWKQSMPEKELKTKATNYISEIRTSALNLRQEISKQKNNLNQRTGRSQDLEL